METNMLGRVKIQIRKSYYTHDRYKTEATFALLYHNQPLQHTELGEFVRISDHFIKLDDHHYFITFAHTGFNAAYKASQNLVLHLDNFFNETTSCVALDSFDTSNSVQIVLSRLEKILEVARHSPFARIQDENALDERL